VIAERTAAFAAFCGERFPPRGGEAAGANGRQRAGGASFGDDEVIARARGAANAPKFLALWAGDTGAYSGDDSAADLALLSLLAFWTQDETQLDRLFRRSGLMRSKWERADYRARTIARALDRDEVYEPPPTPHRSAGNNGASAKANAGERPDPCGIADVAETFRRWLYFPSGDLGVLYASLGAAAANLYATDPAWLLNVGASSGGKTEVILAIAAGLPSSHHAATLTEAALLSGSPKRERAADAKGGLLRAIGDFGILVMKDFTSVLSMNRDQRGALLAALREIYDGSWTRHVGTDGGRTLHWSGKLGLIAGCTTAIDTHHSVMATMGERFLLNRLPEIDPAEQAARALDNTGHEGEMRRELGAAVASLFAGLDLHDTPLPAIDGRERAGLVALSSLVAAARSGVERDAYRREIDFVHDTEAPARLAVSLRRLYAGMLGIGLDRATAWPLVVKVGLDSIPKPRRAVLDILLATPGCRNTTELATEADLPTVTARRALEDLTAHHVVERLSEGPGKADVWRLGDAARDRHAAASTTFSEKSDG
jgi:hypothetical protein